MYQVSVTTHRAARALPRTRTVVLVCTLITPLGYTAMYFCRDLDRTEVYIVGSYGTYVLPSCSTYQQRPTSSLASTRTTPDLAKNPFNKSFETTSSFFCWSPPAFSPPPAAMPVAPAMAARCTSIDMPLQAASTAANRGTMSSSPRPMCRLRRAKKRMRRVSGCVGNRESLGRQGLSTVCSELRVYLISIGSVGGRNFRKMLRKMDLYCYSSEQ